MPLPNHRAAEPDVADVFKRLQGASKEDFVSELERRIDSDFVKRPDAEMAFMIRWVMEDAEGAADYLIQFFEESGGENERYMDLMDLFFMVWLKQDRAGLEAYTAGLVAQGHPLAEEFEELAQEGGGSDPAGFLDGLKPQEYRAKQWEIGEALKNLAAKDPAAALAFFNKLSDETASDVRGNVMRNLALGLTQNDAGRALAWANGMEQRKDRATALDHVITTIAKHDVTAAAAAFEKFRSVLKSSNSSQERILYEYAEQDVASALEWLGDMAGEDSDSSRSLRALNQFLPRDPAEFRALLDGMEPSMIRTNLALEMSIDYASGPGEFLTKMAEMPDDEMRGYMLSKGIDQWMRQSPAAAKESILTLPESIRAKAAERALASREAFKTVAEGVEFARATGVDPSRGQFAHWMGARPDAVDAADFFADVEPTPGQRYPATAAFLQGWAAQDPQAAASWVAEQNGGDQPALAGGLVAGWLQTDPTAASEWAANLEPGEARSAAAFALARELSYQDAEAAFLWGLEVENVAEREQMLRQAFVNWSRLEPEKAKQAMMEEERVPQSMRDDFLLR